MGMDIKNVDDAMALAKKSGRYVAAVFWVDGDKVYCYRQSQDFPIVRMPDAVQLLAEDFEREVPGVIYGDTRKGDVPASGEASEKGEATAEGEA